MRPTEALTPTTFKTCQVQWGRSTPLNQWSPMRSFLPWQRSAFIVLFKRNVQICSQDDPVYNAYERDIALVNLFFPDSTVFGQSSIQKVKLWKIPYQTNIIKNITSAEFEKSPKMTWFDFISSFGGFCGLCLGISFVSVVEILYWFSIRLCRNFALWIKNFYCTYYIRQLKRMGTKEVPLI